MDEKKINSKGIKNKNKYISVLPTIYDLHISL